MKHMAFPYNETVLEHFRHPHNVGEMENPDGKAIEGSPACGDMVSVYIKVDAETKVIEDIKFESYGCASNIATGSIITDLAKGKTLDEAKKHHLEAGLRRAGRPAADQGPLLGAGGRGPARRHPRLRGEARPGRGAGSRPPSRSSRSACGT